jgi:hypothetical protein
MHVTTPLEAVTRAVRPVTARSDALSARTTVRPGVRRPHADRAVTQGSPDDPRVPARLSDPLGATTAMTATSAATGANDVPARAVPGVVAARPLDPAVVMNDRTLLGAVKRAVAGRVAPATREVRARVVPASEAPASTKTVSDDPAPLRAAYDQVSRANGRVSTKPANDDPAPLRAAHDQVSRASGRVSTKPANDDPVLAPAAHDRVTPDRADPTAPVRATISHDALRRDSIGDRRAS